MAKDPTKPATRTGRATRSRQELMRRDRRRADALMDHAFRSPTTAWTVAIWGLFIIVCTAAAAWTRQQPLVAVGRVMNDTALVRVQFDIDDPVQTEASRRQAMLRTPRVYNAIPSVLESLRTSIENLPKILATVKDLESAPPDITKQLQLTEAGLEAIRDQAVNGDVSLPWKRNSQELITLLHRRPLLDDATYQRELNDGSAREVELRSVEGKDGRLFVQRDLLVNIKLEKQLEDSMTLVARAAGFTEPALRVVVSRLITNPEPTFQYDDAATNVSKNARAASVPTVRNKIDVNQVIYKRGEKLTPAALELYRKELATFQSDAESWRLWVRVLSVFGAVTAIAMAVAGYLTLFCPRVRRNPGRMAGIAGLLGLSLVVSCAATVANPAMLSFTALAPTVFVAVILVIAYDQRVSLALGTLHAVLTCIALDQPIGMYALMLTGISFAVLQLRDIRDRQTIIRMGMYAAAALSVGTVLVSLIDRPIVPSILYQTLWDALLAGVGGLSVGVLTLSVMPFIERVFSVTTGMTLIELRDPKQPLLRQLQQLAPGTYNHSLNVASIAEAAADSIRADALLTYVGALYHDIGKMNKPDYFVENQAGGLSKHDKLSPAMSLLVIVGHVKDGMAMAEEFSLPRSIRHFIEAHHGTTLVEFFYNRARKQAEQSVTKAKEQPGTEQEMPEEIEYRYPGPKPRTKEVAILMLSDAVESATRTMVEPTPSRIDALVRAIANRRLMDGQFDECELTLRELQTITESISKSVAGIYHGRVQYPSTASYTQADQKRA